MIIFSDQNMNVAVWVLLNKLFTNKFPNHYGQVIKIKKGIFFYFFKLILGMFKNYST